MCSPLRAHRAAALQGNICIEGRNMRQRETRRNKKEITGEQKLRELRERSGETMRREEMKWGGDLEKDYRDSDGGGTE